MTKSTSSPFSPYSDIVIDYNNPIVRGLTDVFLPSQNAWVNLLDNGVCLDTIGSLKATVFGNAYNYPNDDPDGRAEDTFTETSLNEFTIVSAVNPANNTVDHGLMTVADTGLASWSVLHWADTVTSELRPALGVSVDGGSTNDIEFGTANTIIVGQMSTVVASRKVSGEFRFAVNGDYSTAVASSLVPDVAQPKEFRLAARSSLIDQALEGDAFAFFMFNRQLSEVESISLSNDPFQIFKPIVDPITTALTAALSAGPPAGTGANNPNDFICGIAGLTAIAVPDKWQEYLTGKGFPYGSFNDSQFDWLGTNGGFTGSLTDRTATWRAAGFPDL